MYPRKLLTRHFWTLQQRSEFAVLNLQDRISYNLKVFRFLQSKLSQVKNDVNYEKWRHALGLVGSGTHPTSEEVISVKDLFAAAPYKTSSLSYRHLVSALVSSVLIYHTSFCFELTSLSFPISIESTLRSAWR